MRIQLKMISAVQYRAQITDELGNVHGELGDYFITEDCPTPQHIIDRIANSLRLVLRTHGIES